MVINRVGAPVRGSDFYGRDALFELIWTKLRTGKHPAKKETDEASKKNPHAANDKLSRRLSSSLVEVGR
jgi:hypothetical protein